MDHFEHPAAIVETSDVGSRTRIWAFAHVLAGARIGANCNICDHTFIENDVVVGNDVTIKCGVQLWDGVRLEDGVFVGPNATFTNDSFPRSGHHQTTFPHTVVKRGASIGANATVLPGIVIGERAMVGAGAVVTRDVPPDAIVAGNPARITGYVASNGRPLTVTASAPYASGVGTTASAVRGVVLHTLPLIEDLRGLLSFGETQRHIPFSIERYFLVFGVPGKEVRGEHAHRTLHQFLLCVHGSCHCVVDDGTIREEYVLDRPTKGIHVPPMCWCVQYKYSADAVLLVLASAAYDPADYIRDYSDFLLAVSQTSR
jgi:UDP-2-acetamido-3-amino-2,3-dideoxy-glucuronate N-acetyltransferase